MSCREGRDTHYMHVCVDGLLGNLFGRREQRADVNIESHVSERRYDDLLTAVVAVLPHLGDQDTRTTPLIDFKLVCCIDDTSNGTRIASFCSVHT